MEESVMRQKGIDKVYNTIKNKSGKLKDISNTQLGQKLIFDESLRVLPMIKKWIVEDSARVYRKGLSEFFYDDEFLLEKITQSYFFIAGAIYNDPIRTNSSIKKVRTRHKKIDVMEKRILPGLGFDLTWRFVEVLVEFSNYFESSSNNVWRGGYRREYKYVCHLSEVILEELSIIATTAFYPLPLNCPPKDWSIQEGIVEGGYHTYQYDLIRSNEMNKYYSKISPQIIDAANYIQSTPWRINRVLLEVVKQDLIRPSKADFIKSDFPSDKKCQWQTPLEIEDFDSEEQMNEVIEARKIFSDKIELYNAECGDYESALGKYRAVKMAINIAEMFVDTDIWFPHNYDFRGRIYPISIGLSPQGSDTVKSLLEYKNGQKLNETGEKWMWAYLASLYGDDKLPFEQRIERGKELLGANYKDADEPYQFLAHQIEINKWLSDPDYEVKARIHLDACNSGSQFTSAITGDIAGCEATNVIPVIENGVQIRKDAYLLVSEKSLNEARQLSLQEENPHEAEMYGLFSQLLSENGRKICKRPVMVSNYGGTAGGRAEILWDMMRELRVDRKWIKKKTASVFAKIVGDSITGVLNGGKLFEIYIHKMNNLITKDNCPITWTTGDGFFVIHKKNKELKSKSVSCMLPGSRKKTTITKKVYSKNVSPAKMKSAISPNYIHSLDAELLRRVALKMKEQGIVDSDWIHDSFGCGPNHVNMMLDITKQEFLHMMEKDPLKKLHSELVSQILPKHKKDLESITVPYPREDFSISKVIDSDWFFS